MTDSFRANKKSFQFFYILYNRKNHFNQKLRKKDDH